MCDLKKIIENKLFKQLMKFLLVGGTAFLIDYILLYVLTEYVGVFYLYSSIISFTVALIFNYYVSIKWVFDIHERHSKMRNFIYFIVLSLIGLLINQAIMYFMVDLLKIYYMVTKLFATAVVMCFNFITRKKFLEK